MASIPLWPTPFDVARTRGPPLPVATRRRAARARAVRSPGSRPNRARRGRGRPARRGCVAGTRPPLRGSPPRPAARRSRRCPTESRQGPAAAPVARHVAGSCRGRASQGRSRCRSAEPDPARRVMVRAWCRRWRPESRALPTQQKALGDQLAVGVHHEPARDPEIGREHPARR